MERCLWLVLLCFRLVLDSIGIDSVSAEIRVGIDSGLNHHPGIRIGINYAGPKSESELIQPMNADFSPQ